MFDDLQYKFANDRLWIWAIVVAILLGAMLFGAIASVRWFALLVAAIGFVILLQRPIWGLTLLVLVALVGPIQFGTGTEVSINLATLLVPALLGVWILGMVHQQKLELVASGTNKPLMALLLSGLLSLVIGYVLWDPTVSRSSNFILVQLAQWAIFAFSAGAFWLAGNLANDEAWVRRLTLFFLTLAGALAVLRVLPGTASLARRIGTMALDRSPFWLLLIALAGGQLLFNKELSSRWRLFLWAVVGACLIYAFYLERATASNWVGVAGVVGMLAWLRWPRLRWPVIIVLTILGLSGVLSSTVYEFAGGSAEWEESGGSRLVLIGRVIDVTMYNPITGLGPAAYRDYALVEPLFYEGAYYRNPLVSSHNNYVDLFSHVGLLGLGLFFWFAAAVARLGLRLRARFTEGFAAAYVNGMLAAGAASLVLMLFADWILPFVYNIGFPGFQASILVWLFLGGLVALDHIAVPDGSE